MSAIKVLLEDNQAEEFKSMIYSLITEEVEKARFDSSIGRQVVNQVEIADYLRISPTTVREYEKLGMPFGCIGKRKFYNKNKCADWVTEQQID
ncbi:MerR family transcriptional regulator [Enterococcus sp. BWM-S5]|uniref:MerR family transcriptional regulator n=1 Tax=Enterococcus larvae TaxID=2794352 RepID=A0ABS4CKG4_9ENTE|nr:MerR family transcriptional regulator [Enterococcus larvae]MBP1047101.1 MerR family transcriptional regulator [Enterococcus larvae]